MIFYVLPLSIIFKIAILTDHAVDSLRCQSDSHGAPWRRRAQLTYGIPMDRVKAIYHWLSNTHIYIYIYIYVIYVNAMNGCTWVIYRG